MFKRSEERKLTRLQGYDYSQNGYYFVTICVDDMEHWFGRINDGKMILNKYGKIAKQCLNDLSNNYDNCFLDETIIMPNHIHCIIIVDNDICRGRFPFDSSANVKPLENMINFEHKKNGICFPHIKKTGVVWETTPTEFEKSKRVSKQGTNGNRPLQFKKRHKLGEMIRSFKSNFTRQIKPNITFKWQRSFNDHIIRNEKELYAIRKYIRDNPTNW